MKDKLSTFLVSLLVFLSIWIVTGSWWVAARDVEQPWAAPEFTHTSERDWINTQPLKLADLRGKVVLVDFWTFGCWNCYRSFPWLKQLEARFEEADFLVIGVHSPEFDHEKDRKKVSAKVTEFELSHPVMVDNDFSYWKAMNNRYWPTFYLIDKRGRVRASFIGETHTGDSNAQAIEGRIIELLKETAPS